MPESEIVKTLTQLWGIGPWTAEMTAIFFFGLPDVWSKGDVALARGLALIAEKEGVSEQEILSTVTPYRSYFALHVWQSLDTDLFTSMAN
jgi:DNA-3-methyladenine glycosylase II